MSPPFQWTTQASNPCRSVFPLESQIWTTTSPRPWLNPLLARFRPHPSPNGRLCSQQNCPQDCLLPLHKKHHASGRVAPSMLAPDVLSQFSRGVPPQGGAALDVVLNPDFNIRTAKIGLTCAQCPVPLVDAFRLLSAASRTTKGARGVEETHAGGGSHLHIIVQKSNSAIPLRSFILTQDGGDYRPDGRVLSTTKYQASWHFHLEKQGEPGTSG